MSRIVIFVLLFLYSSLSAFTQISGETGEGVSGRVIFADFFALGLFLPAIVFHARIRLTASFWFYLAFLGAVFISLALSNQPQKGLVEYLVLVFNFAVGVMLYNLMTNARELSLADVIYPYFYAVALIAVLSLFKLFFFPSWFGGSMEMAGLTGPFRNTGQSGTYFGMGLAIFVPALATGLIRRNAFNLFLLAVIVITLFLTVKRAAIIGFGVGILGLFLTSALSGPVNERGRNLAVFAIGLAAAPIALYLFEYLIENASGFDYRVSYKVTNFSVESSIDRFFGENLSAAVKAFEENPFLGAGLGNIIGRYTEYYEIHSTPFSILSSAGVVGILAYAAFMSHFLQTIWNAGTGALAENRFMRLVFPMVIGLCVSWLYTYHIRKREFWILYATLMFGSYLVAHYRQASGFTPPPAAQPRPPIHRTMPAQARLS